ncbi:hypothetical protein [Streptomyces catenulae]|uniref:Uncharacterized protein n=1 Tax=Streptomyces catenulae TaxID=66875 RepID=A0ABV2Z8M7_9ACTN|nr:hypothetical protein [Streptomyces catenulae]
MRNLIAHALKRAASLLSRTPGRHTERHLRTQEPPLAPASDAPANPWSRPWTGPSSAQVRAIFRPEGEEETTLTLSPIQRERRYAAAFALIGIDYDYPGAPHPTYAPVISGAAA